MHEHCPNCGIRFQRESGYFSMAIFVGYFLAGALAVPGVVVALALQLSLFWVTLLPGVCLVLAAPWIFRYARIIWLHVDERIDPRKD